MKQPITSRLAYDKIMAPGARDTHNRKIILAMERIEQGTNYDLAKASGLKESQVWKRTGKLKEDGIFIDTKLTKLNADGNECIVYAMAERASDFKNVPEREYVYKQGELSATDFASLLIEKSKRINKYKKAITQTELF